MSSDSNRIFNSILIDFKRNFHEISIDSNVILIRF